MTGLPALFFGFGLVAILFALLSFALWLIGAPTDLGWIWANLIVGVALVVFSTMANFDALRERMRSGEARRAGVYGTSAILSTLLSIAIVGLLGFSATRYSVRFDWSEGKVHSLSDQSRKVLAGLEQDVQVLALFNRIDAAPARELLERYAYQSDRFQIEFADPTERPDLIERYAIAPEQLGQGLVRVALGDASTEVQELTEENVTNAIVKLSRTANKRVYFVVGHNERAVEGDESEGREGYSRAADALRNETYQIETLLLAAKGEVPEDADAVVVPGATRPLLREEHEALQRYLERGGALMVLLDPRAKTDLVDTVTGWGVEVGDDVIVDRQLALFGRATTPFASRYDPDHEITRDLRETTLFHVARSVRPNGSDAGAFTEIVFTGESSWAERDLELFFARGRAELDDDDLVGPVSIAVAGVPAVARAGADAAGDGSDGDEGSGEAAASAEEGADAAGEPDVASQEAGEPEAPRDPRLVVFGDSDFASNEFIETYRNRDLFVNTINWLLGDVEAISIRPATSRASRFQLSTQQFQRIRSLSLFVLPESIALLGVYTWWTRRRRPTS